MPFGVRRSLVSVAGGSSVRAAMADAEIAAGKPA
jgi:hypothetical protein